MNKKVMISVVVSLLLGVAGFLYQRYRIPPTIALPAIALTDLHGQPASMTAFVGKPLFISFFATWCGPCRREMPELAAMHQLLSPYHLAIIAISDEPIASLQTLQAQIGNEVLILHSTRSLHDMGVYTFPTNYIYTADGKKVYEQVKPENWTDEAVIERVKKMIE